MHRLIQRLRKRLQSSPPPAAVDLLDLLGRKPVDLDTPELQRFLAGKIVLVTGAGGSIGSEICRQCMRFGPQRIILLDRAENALFEIDRELRQRWADAEIEPCLADICDAPRIAQVFQEHRPHIVFHAAAHKHVPMMEHNPAEAVKNNLFGTKVVADAALSAAAEAFVLISTDKAVNPTSAMGATKRCAELYVQSLNEGSGFRVHGSDSASAAASLNPEPRTLNPASRTRFLAVRFGNVLGSSGSVVPIFQQQIESGGPVTVTHPEMQRYFMTIPEASQLVMQAGAIGRGGEIFVLDMGQPIRILDLAEEMVLRNGLKLGRDIAIQFTGIRPGEKLHEELAATNEQTCPTTHPKIRIWQLPRASAQRVQRMLETLGAVTTAARQDVIAALAQCVAEYQPPALPIPLAPDDQATKLRLLAQEAALAA